MGSIYLELVSEKDIKAFLKIMIHVRFNDILESSPKLQKKADDHFPQLALNLECLLFDDNETSTDCPNY